MLAPASCPAREGESHLSGELCAHVHPPLAYFGISGLCFCYWELGRKEIKLLAWVQPGREEGAPLSHCAGSFLQPGPHRCAHAPFTPPVQSCLEGAAGHRQREVAGEAHRLQGANGTSLWVPRRHLNSSLGITVSQSLISQSTTPHPIPPMKSLCLGSNS